MPDTTRTVSRSVGLLARMGIPRGQALGIVVRAARAAAARTGVPADTGSSWLGQVAETAEAQLRASCSYQDCRQTEGNSYASTTGQAAAAAETPGGQPDDL